MKKSITIVLLLITMLMTGFNYPDKETVIHKYANEDSEIRISAGSPASGEWTAIDLVYLPDENGNYLPSIVWKRREAEHTDERPVVQLYAYMNEEDNQMNYICYSDSLFDTSDKAKGDVVTFGTATTMGGINRCCKYPVEWIVTESDENTLTLLSRYVLDEIICSQVEERNNNFITFSDEERSKIVEEPYIPEISDVKGLSVDYLIGIPNDYTKTMYTGVFRVNESIYNNVCKGKRFVNLLNNDVFVASEDMIGSYSWMLGDKDGDGHYSVWPGGYSVFKKTILKDNMIDGYRPMMKIARK